MAKITYENKVALNEQTEINEINKVTAGNMNEIKASINGILQNLGLLNDTYSSTSTYALNDRVVYQNTLYKCTTAITTAEEWNVEHWTAITFINI